MGEWKNLSNDEYDAQFQIFDVGSKYGIRKGRISKLFIKPKSSAWDKTIISYDRGWDKSPHLRSVPKKAKELYDIILAMEKGKVTFV